ncbi:hypothetical protein ACH41H_45720 [Streptomyces sp. NPDC020800]|uniref:hypothetical protein n=1 Tax=Streptomyces sp. NPDC020800 TaxID=3365092 RepID=UPI0037B19AEE
MRRPHLGPARAGFVHGAVLGVHGAVFGVDGAVLGVDGGVTALDPGTLGFGFCTTPRGKGPADDGK